MSEDKKDENIISSNDNEEKIEKVDNQPTVDEKSNESSPVIDNNISENQNSEENQQNENNFTNETQDTQSNDQKDTNLSNENQNDTTEHQVIHKKDGRLHIYIRQDKYKGELKSKNWVGRLYIDGKQKISSSGTPNLDEAIPILEKWFDDIHAESEKQKKLAEEAQQNQQQGTEQTVTETTAEEKTAPAAATPASPEVISQNINKVEEPAVKEQVNVNNEVVKEPGETTKSKVSNILGKFKNLKFKKPSLKGIKLPQSPVKNKDNVITKMLSFFKSKIGKSSIQGEEVIGVELTNKEIRLAQINSCLLYTSPSPRDQRGSRIPSCA